MNENCPRCLHDLYKPSGQGQINTRSYVLKLKQDTLSYLTPTSLKLSNTLNNLRHGAKDKQRARYFQLIKAVRIVLASISNCCLIFINVSTSEGPCIILIFLSFWNWFNN